VERARNTVLGMAVTALALGPLSAHADSEEAVSIGVGASLLAGIACSALVLSAGEDPEEGGYARRGWAAGLAGTFAAENFEDDVEDDVGDLDGASTSASLDDSWGISTRASYRCHRNFAAEVEVEWLDTFDADISSSGQGRVGDLEVDPIVVTLNAKGYLLPGRIQPFLLGGVGGITAKTRVRDQVEGGSDTDRDSDFAYRLGGGVDFYATKNVVVSADAEYVGTPFGDVDVEYVSVGLGVQYRF
jgi:opacity protein-like surface antigen